MLYRFMVTSSQPALLATLELFLSVRPRLLGDMQIAWSYVHKIGLFT